MTETADVVVVGAGPYGLSVAAHARALGLGVRVFGRPMSAWAEHMAAGMFLKSEPWASNLSAPGGRGTLAEYCRAHGLPHGHGQPVPIEVFTDYGRWFAGRYTPPVEETLVTGVAHDRVGGFAVTLASGAELRATAVVMAVGVLPFTVVPRWAADLPPELATHVSAHHDLSRFAGQDVTVVGAGQSALETATLLADVGAHPRVLARRGGLAWNGDPAPLQRPLTQRLLAPQSGLGPGWSNWVWSQLPAAVHHLPAGMRHDIFRTRLGPAGSWWLRPRFEGRVPVRVGAQVTEATPVGDRLRLTVRQADGGTEQVETDHVISATGYVPDLSRLDLLDPALRRAIRRDGTAPQLNGYFASSLPNLYFVGLAAAYSFGPAQRFVYGARFAATRVAAGLRGTVRPSGPTVVSAPSTTAVAQPVAAGEIAADGAAAGDEA